MLFAIVAVGCATSEGDPPGDEAAPMLPPSTFATTSTTTANLSPTTTRATTVTTLPKDDAGRWQRVDLAPQIAASMLVATGPQGTVAFGGYPLGSSLGTVGWYRAGGSQWAPIDGLQRMIDGVDHSLGWGYVSAVAAWQGGFVAVGGHITLPYTPTPRNVGAAWSSSDGRTWTRVGDDSTFGINTTPAALVRGADAFVALPEPSTDNAGGPTLGPVTGWRSIDGQNWQKVTIDEHAYGVSIAATSFGFVATGIGSSFSPLAPAVLPAIWISSDGRTWRRINTDVYLSAPSLVASIQVVPYRGGAALLARQFESNNGSDNAMTILMTTTDGEHWRAVTAPPCLTAARRDYVFDFAASEDRLMILASIGETPAIITGTPDGAQWRCVSVDPEAFPANAWGPAYLHRLAVNSNGTFTIIGGTALEPGNKPRFHAAIWTENR